MFRQTLCHEPYFFMSKVSEHLEQLGKYIDPNIFSHIPNYHSPQEFIFNLQICFILTIKKHFYNTNPSDRIYF
jgi:hypothetical protein